MSRRLETHFPPVLIALIGLFLPFAPGPLKASDEARRAVGQLKRYLNRTGGTYHRVHEQSFADVALTKQAADRAKKLLWKAHRQQIVQNRMADIKQKEITVDGTTMPLHYKSYGETPPNGRSLYLSLHGGGDTSKQANDRQWENQKTLYRPDEGVLVVPRAPTNDWNLWHKAHIDQLFAELIEAFIVLKNVNPNRVYLMGFSAGGDGVYQLAPRMADRWAAASMMAGHPNDAEPAGLRNVPFTIHVGARDSAYDRNEVARRWKSTLQNLQKNDPNGYRHWVKLHEGKGHWMDRQDAAALPWMAKFVRNPHPERVVWHQDNVLHERMYWLAADRSDVSEGDRVVVEYEGRTVRIVNSDVSPLKIRLNRRMMTLDRPVRVQYRGKTVYEGIPQRTIGTIAQSLSERGDPAALYTAEIRVDLQQ